MVVSPTAMTGLVRSCPRGKTGLDWISVKAQKTKTVLRYLQSLGWVMLRDGQGSHEIWGLPDESVKASIPVGHREVSPGVLRQIKNAGVTLPREWL